MMILVFLIGLFLGAMCGVGIMILACSLNTQEEQDRSAV